MSFDVIIPARYASTRLPGKPLLDLAGKSLIERVYLCARQSDADRVIVATDDERIERAVKEFGGDVCMTAADHASGTDRLAEVVQQLHIDDDRVVVNLQGDEPFAPAKLINTVAASLQRQDRQHQDRQQQEQLVMATACHRLTDIEDINNPNIVKVVMDNNGHAMYFSRAPIPFPRESSSARYYQHVGIYAYRSAFIAEYHALKPNDLELSESLEQLRVMAHGYKIAVETIDYPTGFGIDTPEDLERARQRIVNSNEQ